MGGCCCSEDEETDIKGILLLIVIVLVLMAVCLPQPRQLVSNSMIPSWMDKSITLDSILDSLRALAMCAMFSQQMEYSSSLNLGLNGSLIKSHTSLSAKVLNPYSNIILSSPSLFIISMNDLFNLLELSGL
ncbi:hypothetical protein CTI12_AA442000 [Artemisia annua]|uniref:Uncharacterized protein n=1 Tax=Artemisia annua TaxID=35608 RepID=A0A2U1LXV6_ARTAN|nr:hypothetical protein CTI12_AA442000 [Artemisia annua]